MKCYCQVCRSSRILTHPESPISCVRISHTNGSSQESSSHKTEADVKAGSGIARGLRSGGLLAAVRRSRCDGGRGQGAVAAGASRVSGQRHGRSRRRGREVGLGDGRPHRGRLRDGHGTVLLAGGVRGFRGTRGRLWSFTSGPWPLARGRRLLCCGSRRGSWLVACGGGGCWSTILDSLAEVVESKHGGA